MTMKVKWLPAGHVTHGYRRVFIVEENNAFKHVVVFSMMGFEDVYHVKQKFQPHPVAEPSLLWGLSLLLELLGSPTLAESDDGYISMRPHQLEDHQWLPIERYFDAVAQGELLVEE